MPLASHLTGTLDALDALRAAFAADFAHWRKPRRLRRRWLEAALAAGALLYGAHFLYKHSSYNGSTQLEEWRDRFNEARAKFYREHVSEPTRALVNEVIFNKPVMILKRTFCDWKQCLDSHGLDFHSCGIAFCHSMTGPWT